jgi:CheY-like chemotaxis protein
MKNEHDGFMLHAVDVGPQTLLASRDLLIAERVRTFLAHGGVHSWLVRDANEALKALERASTRHLELDLIIVDVDHVDIDGTSFDTGLVGQIRNIASDTTIGSARRIRHLPIIVLTDDQTNLVKDEVWTIDRYIPVLSRTSLTRFDLLAAVQNRLATYRHDLLRSVQRVGIGIVYQHGRYTIVAPSRWRKQPTLLRTSHVHADLDVVSAAYERLVLVTDRWKWGDLVLNQLEALLNDQRATEQDFQHFFAANPSFLLRNDFDTYWAEPVLRIAPEPFKYFKPDFVLAPRNRQALTKWGILDLKRPDAPILDRSTFHKPFSMQVQRVITQLRDYAEGFARSEHAAVLRKTFGVVPRPRRLVAVIGRRPTNDLHRYKELVRREATVDVLTYDDILDFQRAKIDLIKKASAPGDDEILVPRFETAEEPLDLMTAWRPHWQRRRRTP